MTITPIRLRFLAGSLLALAPALVLADEPPRTQAPTSQAQTRTEALAQSRGGQAAALDPQPLGGIQVEPPTGPDSVSEPVVPTITPAVMDLPDYKPDPGLFGLEMKRRDDFGFIPFVYEIEPRVDPLLTLQTLETAAASDGFSTPVHNYAGQTSVASPPDCTGDVGPNHYVQTTNQSVSTVQVLSKSTGAVLKTFTMQSLATAAPCSSGFCDPVALYDRMADRWIISELPSSGGSVCVYVSTTGDPTGTYYAYSFPVESGLTDYPKYGVWPQNGNGGSYLMGANAGSGSKRDIFALDRAKMLAGLPATFQKFSVAGLPNAGFQLVLPSTVQGSAAPPNGEPAVFMRPHDDEAQDGAATPGYDLMDMWTLSVDWATPANSTLAQLAPIHIGDYDMTLCGLGGTWNCMPQPGTGQKIDPIREPLHFPLQYRNFGDHQTLVGTFVEDVDGTDHAALRWFEIRKTGGGAWGLRQEGVVGGEAGVHRSIGSIAMDGSGDIAIGYTRTGGTTPYYPSIYYKGRLSSDVPGTMPQGEYPVQDASTSKTGNERWGDYAGMSVDPVDDCTFWLTTEYGGSGATRVAAFKFDGCGCLAVPETPVPSAQSTQNNRIDVTWNDSSTASITQYLVYRSTTPGGPYTQIAPVPDSSPGTANGPSYTYHDDTVSGGTRYYYIVKSADGAGCISPGSGETSATATGLCILAPTFAGVTAVSNTSGSACSLNLSWGAGTSYCSAPLMFNVYRSTTPGFTPMAANRIATGVSGSTYQDGSSLSSATTYYYIVRAVDGVNGFEDGNIVQKSGAPTGPAAATNWAESFEGSQSGGGFDLAGWTHSTNTGTTNWTWSSARSQDGAHSWFAAGALSASDKILVSPPFVVGASTTLSFWHTYSFEASASTCNDGGTLEYSPDGTSWTVVPAVDFTAGGYTGAVYSSASNPIAGKPAWCGGTIGPMTQVTVNLGAEAAILNKSVRIRWHEGDNGSNGSTGWYVDTVTVSNAQPVSACTTVQTAGAHASLAGSAYVADACLSGGSGDSDGYFDPGDQIQFSVTIRNDGATPLTGVTASLTAVTAGVTILNGTAGYPDLIGGSTGTSLSPHYTALLPTSLACGAAVRYNITITSNQGTWTGTFTQSVGHSSLQSGKVVNEAFASGIPGSWTIVNGGSGGGAAATWTTANPGGRTATSPITAPFAIADSNAAGTGATQDEALITPVMDLTGTSSAVVSYDEYFRRYLDEIGDVDVRSSLTGGAWVNVVRNQNTDTGNPNHRAVSISAQAAGAPDAQVRFHYYGAGSDWYWQVDNVGVSWTRAAACSMNVCNPVADLSVANDGIPTSAATGQDITYTLIVTNNGPGAAASPVLTGAVPSGTTFRSLASPAGWSCSKPAIGGTGTINCTAATLASGAPAVFTIGVRVNWCAGNGTLIGTAASVSSDASDPNAANNSAAASMTVTDPGSCDDGNPCTGPDVCTAGVCGGTQLGAPPETGSTLTVTRSGSGASIEWSEPAGTFNVYRGSRATAVWSYNQACLAKGVAGPVEDAAVPAAGSTIFYLVTRQSACGESIPGRDSQGSAIPNTSPCR